MVHACGGSFMVKKQWLADGEFSRVKEAAVAAVAVVRQIIS
jgi:2-keto-3-deoxy-6-phosphogluconate aldolase